MAKKTIPAIAQAELDDEKPISMRRLWIKEHMRAIYIGAAILLIIAVFFGIRYYNNISHPLTRFMNASSKNFNSSFSFDLQARKNGETVMKYTGVYNADPAKQDVMALYDADYGTYAYTGAVYAVDETRLSGSLYDGKWRVRDCTEKVLNFFDFNTDYRNGSFDGASFLRFTELTNQYSAGELDSFMQLFKSRMSGNTELAKVEVTTEDDTKTYDYNIDLGAFFDMVRDKGASIFFSSIDYDAFCTLYEKNEKSVDAATCTFSFTVNSAGYLSETSLQITVGGEDLSVHCAMGDFATAKVDIPQEFFDAQDEEVEEE